MRAIVLAIVALLLAPGAAEAGHHGHLKKLKEHHQQHKFKHQMKKALKEGCNCDENGVPHGHHHKVFHHHNK